MNRLRMASRSGRTLALCALAAVGCGATASSARAQSRWSADFAIGAGQVVGGSYYGDRAAVGEWRAELGYTVSRLGSADVVAAVSRLGPFAARNTTVCLPSGSGCVQEAPVAQINAATLSLRQSVWPHIDVEAGVGMGSVAASALGLKLGPVAKADVALGFAGRAWLTVGAEAAWWSANGVAFSTDPVVPRHSLFTEHRPSREVRPARAGARRDPALASPVLDERAPVQLVQRLPQLLLRVHHDRPVPRHRLLRSACPTRAGSARPRRPPAPSPRPPRRTAPASGCPPCRAPSPRHRGPSSPTRSVSAPNGSEAPRNVPLPSNTYANACRYVSTGSVLRTPGGTDTSRYCGSAAMPSTGPVLPQKSPHTTRTTRAVVVGHLGDVPGPDVLVARIGHLAATPAGCAQSWKPCIRPLRIALAASPGAGCRCPPSSTARRRRRACPRCPGCRRGRPCRRARR